MTVNKKVETSGHGPYTIRYTLGFKLPYTAQYSSANAEISAEATGQNKRELLSELESFCWQQVQRMLDRIASEGPDVDVRRVRSSSRKQRRNRHGNED